MDRKKAKYYYELAAIGGNSAARTFLGGMEMVEGNMDRALKHYMIAVKGGITAAGGCNVSLEKIRWLYMNKYATKDDYAKALRAYQEYLEEIRSEQRDEAAAILQDRYY